MDMTTKMFGLKIGKNISFLKIFYVRLTKDPLVVVINRKVFSVLFIPYIPNIVIIQILRSILVAWLYIFIDVQLLNI